MTYIIINLLFTLTFGLGVYFLTKKKKWKYLLRKNKQKLPNVDQGYWEIKGPAGQTLRFTDDALRAAHKRYLEQTEDGVVTVNTKPTKI